MKPKLVLITLLPLLLCFTKGIAQNTPQKKDSFQLRNAYEIAKQLNKVYAHSSNYSNTVKQQLLGSIMWYANLQDIDGNQYDSLKQIIKKYSALNTDAIYIFNQLIQTENFFKIDSLYPRFTDITDPILRNGLKDSLKAFIKKRDTIQTENGALNTDSANYKVYHYSQPINFVIDSLIEDSNIQKKTLDILPRDTVNYNKDSIQLKSDSINLKQLRPIQNDITAHNSSIIRLKKDSVQIHDDTKNLISNKQNELWGFLSQLNHLDSSSNSYHIVSDQAIASFNEAKETKIDITSSQEAAAAAFHIPSESEAIDAIAIYLANRIKSEAVMWFFEELTKNIKTYDLLRTYFPNTIILLRSRETYEIPNMGSAWRYALSKDFANMPKNVLNSDWLAKRWPQSKQYKDYLLGACDMAELLVKRYTYRDILESLYLSDTTSNTNDTSIRFHDFVSLLYAVNTELFLPDTAAKYRLLKYEDYRNMNKDEIEIMLSLVDMKYGNVFSKFLKNVKTISGNDTTGFVFTATAIEKIRQWLGKIEIGVSQIETVRNDFIKAQNNSNDGTNKSLYTQYDIWNAVDGLLHFFTSLDTSSNTIFSSGLAKCNTALNYIDQVHEIYGQISNKNFAGAVQSSLSLIDTLLYGYNGDKNDSLRVSLRKGRDSSWLRNINDIPQLLQNIRKYPEQLSQLKQLKWQSDSVAGKLDSQITRLKKALNDSSNLLTDNSLKSMKKNIKSLKHNKKDQNKNYNETEDAANTNDQFNFSYDPVDSSISFLKSSPLAAIIFEKDRHAVELIRQLSGFLNDAALAKNDKELSKVVESYAMPVGSYRRKRNNWWSLDLNAFAGPYFGYEHVINRSTFNQTPKSSGTVYGFSVPIGLSLSKTLGRKLKNAPNIDKDSLSADYILNPDKLKLNKGNIYVRSNWTITLTASIFDLGAAVSYRLRNNSDTTLPQQVKLSQFISPGLHLSVAIPGTPLVAMSGVEYTPQLRNFADTTPVSGNYSNSYNAYRFYVSVMFDLPLFNLWERSRVVYKAKGH